MGYLRAVLEGMAADDGRSVDRIPILPEAERRLVLREWNATEAAYPREACVHELVEAQVERTPGAVAVVFEGERVTYAELNARANRLAHHLRALGVGPDARVGICVERSVEMVVGLLGILKAGGAYVPLDPGYPVERLRTMLEDSAPAVLLTHPPQAATAAALSAGSAVPVLDLTTRRGMGGLSGDESRARGARAAEPGARALHLGLHRAPQGGDAGAREPGEPAGVDAGPVRHGARRGDAAEDAVLLRRLVLGVLLAADGGRPAGDGAPRTVTATRRTWPPRSRRRGSPSAHFVPSMLQLFLEHPEAGRCTGLLRVPVSGEAVSAALVRQFHQRLPGVELTNQYGPTESGEVTEWACDPGAARVSIGRAIHNSAVYVLDRSGEPVPVGVAGELFSAAWRWRVGTWAGRG